MSRSGVFLIDVSATENKVDALMDARDVVDQSAIDPQPFAFSELFVYTELVSANRVAWNMFSMYVYLLLYAYYDTVPVSWSRDIYRLAGMTRVMPKHTRTWR